jgi:GT2 family glycosyltransferase
VVFARQSRLGYGAAANLGARATDGEIFAVINPDVAFDDPSSLEQLAGAFQDERVAIVAPGLILPNGRIQDSARCIPTPVDLVLRRRIARRLGRVSKSGPVPWVTGACLLIRRSAFEEVGGFDEGYPLYFEDVDICVRLALARWGVWYMPEVRFLHRHTAASRGFFLSRPALLHARSALRFYRKHPRHILRRNPVFYDEVKRDHAEPVLGTGLSSNGRRAVAVDGFAERRKSMPG